MACPYKAGCDFRISENTKVFTKGTKKYTRKLLVIFVKTLVDFVVKQTYPVAGNPRKRVLRQAQPPFEYRAHFNNIIRKKTGESSSVPPVKKK